MVLKRDLFCGRLKRGLRIRGWVGPVRLDFTYSRRHGHALVAFAVLEVRDGSRRAGPEWSVDVPKKPDQTAPETGAVRRLLAVPKWLEKTPVLASYLLDLDYEDGGGPREQSYITLRPTRVSFDVTLKDPDTCRQLRVSVADMGTMFAALEALLVSGTCPWEDDRWALERRPKKKK